MDIGSCGHNVMHQVVLQGVREDKGMVSFAAALNPGDSAAIRAFLVSRANALLAAAPPAVPPAAATQDVHSENAQ